MNIYVPRWPGGLGESALRREDSNSDDLCYEWTFMLRLDGHSPGEFIGILDTSIYSCSGGFWNFRPSDSASQWSLTGAERDQNRQHRASYDAIDYVTSYGGIGCRKMPAASMH